MSYKITNNNGNMYPPEVLVDFDTIALDDAEIDASLPDSCRVLGTIIYNADYSVIKTKDFDGSWVEVSK